ncbi:MAG: LTA synthase family protein [Clostridia bacterium]|nr:LTA synthase family protein [Clostridia bacterium]
MLKNSKNKTEKGQKAPKEPIKTRISNIFDDASISLNDFRENSLKSFSKWLILYVGIAFLSLFIFNADRELSLLEFPFVLALITPRMMTLFLFTSPILGLKKKKSAFVFMTSLWFLWHCIAYDRIKLGLATAVILILFSVLVYFGEKVNEELRYRSLFNHLQLYVLYSVMMVFILQIAQMKSFTKPFAAFLLHPDIFACNLLCLAAFGSFVFWVRRPKVAISLYTILWATLAVISFCKSKKTFEPVLFLDAFSVKEGLRAFFTYYSMFFVITIIVLIIAAIVGIVFLTIKERKVKFSLVRMISSFVFVMLVFCSVYFISSMAFMQTESKTGKNEYDKKGFVYSFLFYSVDSLVVEPDGYNSTVIDTIYDTVDEKYTGYDAPSNVQNVIVIQLESFCDILKYPGLKLEKDPMPFMRSLMNDYTSGYVKVPVFGGLTVKSEFEFITGLSIQNVPLGYSPYVQHICDNPMDSLTRYFTGEGFDATAIHNYQGEFFSRHEVYENLGFDTYIPYECMPDVEKIPSRIWGNDEVFLNHIDQALDSNGDNKNFVYAITVQLHGEYKAIPESEYTMKISGIKDKEQEGAIAYYVQQLQEVDDMVKQLITMLSEREESTYVMFYGDHLPSLFVEVSEEMSHEQKYSTPFFTWNNMGIQKSQLGNTQNEENFSSDLDLFKLSTLMCKELAIDGSFMNKFHNVYNDVNKYASEFSSIQYYKMYDEGKEVDFSNDNYKIGLLPLTITEISKSDTEEDAYVIKGTGFTKDTYFCINNKTVYNLKFIDENQVILSGVDDELSVDDKVSLRIIGEKLGNVLKESKQYEWSTINN